MSMFHLLSSFSSTEAFFGIKLLHVSVFTHYGCTTFPMLPVDMANSLQSLHRHRPSNPKQKLLLFSFVKLLGFVVLIKDLPSTMLPLITYGQAHVYISGKSLPLMLHI